MIHIDQRYIVYSIVLIITIMSVFFINNNLYSYKNDVQENSKTI